MGVVARWRGEGFGANGVLVLSVDKDEEVRI